MKLFDANELKRRVIAFATGCNTTYLTIDNIIMLLNQSDTVDAVPVVHGRWTESEDGDGAVCSVCGEDFCNVYLEVERFLYCPNCGAKMDGDGNG